QEWKPHFDCCHDEMWMGVCRVSNDGHLDPTPKPGLGTQIVDALTTDLKGDIKRKFRGARYIEFSEGPGTGGASFEFTGPTTFRSSNRTGGSPASGSRTRLHAFHWDRSGPRPADHPSLSDLRL